MYPRCLTRRASLMLPVLLFACGEERQDFPTLRYGYLPQIRLNVARVDIQQRFIPSGRLPDVSQLSPARPVDAVYAMAEDRLAAVGTVGIAVFAINDASLVKHDDEITGRIAVELSIHAADGKRLGFAQAQVARQHTGHIDDLRETLYSLTKAMMDAMNVEFEYQLRRNLGPWLPPESAVPAPVQQRPLETSRPVGE